MNSRNLHHQAQGMQLHRMGLRVSPREPKAGGWDNPKKDGLQGGQEVAKAGFNSLESSPNDPASLYFLCVAIEAEE